MHYPTKEFAAQRCTYWIERLEAQIEDLLRDASIDKLPPKECFNLAAKYLDLLHQFLLLTQRYNLTEPTTESERILERFKAHLRGE